MTNDHDYFISGRVNHHVSAHQRLRLCAGTQVSPEFRMEVELLDPTVGSFLLDDVVHGCCLDPCSVMPLMSQPNHGNSAVWGPVLIQRIGHLQPGPLSLLKSSAPHLSYRDFRT